VLPGLTSTSFESEGLLGDTLPIPVLHFPVSTSYIDVSEEKAHVESRLRDAIKERRYEAAAQDLQQLKELDQEGELDNTTATTLIQSEDGFWEMSVVPVANGTGFEQPVFFRFLQVNSSVLSGKTEPGVLYFDTFEYVPSFCPTSETMAGCVSSLRYYSAILDVHFFWERTWEEEGVMKLFLPAREDTDGGLLVKQAVHSILVDMTTRTGGIWPRYGTMPGYDQGGIGPDPDPNLNPNPNPNPKPNPN